MGQLTQVALGLGVAVTLLASPVIGLPIAVAVTWVAWRRAASGLLAATVVLVVVYGAWLAATTPV